jgi:hypothetical protein
MQDALRKMRDEAHVPAVKTVLDIADELEKQGWDNITELNLESSSSSISFCVSGGVSLSDSVTRE